MSSFEEYAYSTYLIEKAEKEKKLIDRQLELKKEIEWIVEYRKSLINEILIINK